MNTCVNITLYVLACTLFTVGEGIIIGVDLGTTYCSVAIFRDGIVEVIPNDIGNRMTPSYVAFTDTGERLIGETAKLQITNNPLNTIYNVKRLIGRKWDDKVVQKEIPLLPFYVVKMEDKPYIKVKINRQDVLFSPEEITAMILERMKDFAEDYIGEEVDSAVITTPAYFNEEQRQATKDAGALAGLNVRRILSEPTAAAMCFGLSHASGEMKILVFDIGGGTFDVSILELDEGNFRVLATKGDTDLGGEDFNQRLLIHFIHEFKAETGENMAANPKSIQILRQEIEKAKRVLSVSLIAKIEINNLYENKGFFTSITRAKFENLNKDLFTRTMSIVTTVLEDSGLQREDIDEIVVVGGSSRIIKIQQLLKEFFGKDPRLDIHPDEAIACGAAVQAGVLSNEKHTEHIVLLDVFPFSLGYELSNGTMKIIIPHNHVIPYEASKIVTTAKDNQLNVRIQIYRGDHSTASKNVLLGWLVYDRIPAALQGVPTIKVTFELNADGILTVSARNVLTGNYKEIVLKNVYRKLSHIDLAEMRVRMMSFRFSDLKRKERINAKDTIEQVVYSIKNCINEMINLLKANTAQIVIDISQQFYDCLNILHSILWYEFTFSLNVKSYHRIRQNQVSKNRDFKQEVLSIREYIDENITWLDKNQDATSEQLKRKVGEIYEYLDRKFWNHDNTEQQSTLKQNDEL